MQPNKSKIIDCCTLSENLPCAPDGLAKLCVSLIGSDQDKCTKNVLICIFVVEVNAIINVKLNRITVVTLSLQK